MSNLTPEVRQELGDTSDYTQTPQTPEDIEAALAKQTKIVPPFWKNKWEKEAAKNWDTFYKRNSVHFFKDRHYLHEELPILTGPCTWFEVGCGVGNSFYPIVAENPDVVVHCCDFSKRAIELVREHELFDAERINAFVLDIVKDSIPDSVPNGIADVTSLIFVLSAIPPEHREAALRKLVSTMKPGGVLLFRDYGRHDAAQLRLEHKFGENYYMRGDLTLTYFFSLDEVKELAASVGLTVVNIEMLKKEIINRKDKVLMHRQWVHALLQKPE
eukprot:TRINITY_DN3709_c0_g2_i2.p1 TRINITY_DN3709_c0_g2~~TRINITY_DN3709_c0_g2_i2.p1  ORF type:complete len:272 (+),score=9.86 TRINITY_DN3709_c0_g2_i2:127-942(+)